MCLIPINTHTHNYNNKNKSKKLSIVHQLSGLMFVVSQNNEDRHESLLRLQRVLGMEEVANLPTPGCTRSGLPAARSRYPHWDMVQTLLEAPLPYRAPPGIHSGEEAPSSHHTQTYLVDPLSIAYPGYPDTMHKDQLLEHEEVL